MPEEQSERKPKDKHPPVHQMSTIQPALHKETIVVPDVKVAHWLQGFTDFIREQGVVGLALGFVFGAQVKSLVDIMVASFITPLIAMLLPGNGDLAQKGFHLQHGGKVQVFLWGAFVAQLISFIITIAILYFIIKALKLDKLDRKK